MFSCVQGPALIECQLIRGFSYKEAAEPVNLENLKISEDGNVVMEDVPEEAEEEEEDAALEDIQDLYEDDDEEGTRKKRKRAATDDGRKVANGSALAALVPRISFVCQVDRGGAAFLGQCSSLALLRSD